MATGREWIGLLLEEKSEIDAKDLADVLETASEHKMAQACALLYHEVKSGRLQREKKAGVWKYSHREGRKRGEKKEEEGKPLDPNALGELLIKMVRGYQEKIRDLSEEVRTLAEEKASLQRTVRSLKDRLMEKNRAEGVGEGGSVSLHRVQELLYSKTRGEA